jgi:ElaB/YqjD/DUF883 family membrane-anchored ribosome-binding protein
MHLANRKEVDMNIERSTDRLVGDLRRLMRDSEDLLHATKDAVDDKARAVRERLGEALTAAKRTCNQLEEKAGEGVRAADRAIRQHPYESIGIAFGIGLLIGVLATRK